MEASFGALVAVAPAAGVEAEGPSGPEVGDWPAEEGVEEDAAFGLPGEVQLVAADNAATRSTVPMALERPLFMGCFLSRAVFV